MLIGIDGNEANTNIRVGVGQYAFNLLWELYRQNKKENYYIYLKEKAFSDLPPESDHWHYLVFGPKFLWTKFALPLHLLFKRPRPQLFYSPSHYSPAFSPVPTIPTIHDIGYLNYQEQFTKKDLYQLINWTKSSINRAKHIVAVSSFTKNELIKTYEIPPEKISIVYNGVFEPPQISQQEIQRVKRKFKINSPYFLAVGTLKPNKNYPFLIKAFSTYLKSYSSKTLSYQLVIAGKKGWLYQEIEIVLKKLGITHEVIFTDFISEKEKWALYKGAICLVIPSTYEGFGIPAIESQSIGTPVIASSIPSLKEVLKDSVLYIDPEDINSLITAFGKIQDKDFSEKLIRKGREQSSKFTWKKSARDLSLLFQQLL
jgi:glycosyltransferase involved in cell wall biosynthesis